MKTIDGSRGGGQLLRWAISIASLDSQSIRVEYIRGARDPSGLRPQHVAAVNAAAAITDAEVANVSVGAETIEFKPATVTGGEASVDVGTAGSLPLVFDTVLPFGMVADEPITLQATGGTDVKWSPPIDYHRQVKLPFLERFGLHAGIDIERRGFYPKGGGMATLTTEPSDVTSIECTDRGEVDSIGVISLATADLSDDTVAERQAQAVREGLDDGLQVAIETTADYVEASSTGSVVLVVANYKHAIAGFSALGEAGKPAEAVAEDAVDDWRTFHDSNAAIDRHLADQLLPFLAVVGGELTTPDSTQHIETAAELLSQFGHDVDVRERGDVCRITATGD